MSTATVTNSMAAEPPPGDIGDMESLLRDLEAETGILGHVANSPNAIEAGQLILIEDHLIDIQRKLMALWRAAWERDQAYRGRAGTMAHGAACPPGKEDAEALWQMLRSISRVIVRSCDEAAAVARPAAPASDADAELIALAANYAEANAEIRRLEANKDEADAMAYVPLDARRYAARETAADLTAATLAGLKAKAAIYLGEIDLMFGKPDGETRDRDTTDLLADSIARDVLAIGGAPGVPAPTREAPAAGPDTIGDMVAVAERQPKATPAAALEAPPAGWRDNPNARPDATVLHLGRELMRLDARIKVLNEVPDAEQAGMDAVIARQHALLDTLIETPASTAAGWRAKGEALAAAIEADVVSLDPEHRLALSLAADLMREIKAPR